MPIVRVPCCTEASEIQSKKTPLLHPSHTHVYAYIMCNLYCINIDTYLLLVYACWYIRYMYDIDIPLNTVYDIPNSG